ncbi:MAG: M23 family metallopeptidase [Stackebrandtia sp.]
MTTPISDRNWEGQLSESEHNGNHRNARSIGPGGNRPRARRHGIGSRTIRGRYAASIAAAIISAGAASLAMVALPETMHHTAAASHGVASGSVVEPGQYRRGTEGFRPQAVSDRADRRASRHATPTLAQPAERYWRTPLDSFDLTSLFGARWGTRHEGLDFGAPHGTVVHAAYPGRVVSAGWNDGGYGNLVIVEHSHGLRTYYAHNSSVSVSPGDAVSTGDQIANVGDTGDSFGPHCHFEVRRNDTPIDPLPFLADHGVDVMSLADNVLTDDGPSPY